MGDGDAICLSLSGISNIQPLQIDDLLGKVCLNVREDEDSGLDEFEIDFLSLILIYFLAIALHIGCDLQK